MNTQRSLTYVAAQAASPGSPTRGARGDGRRGERCGRDVYLSGLCLLALGSIGIVLRLLERRPRWLRVAGAVLAPLGFVAIFLFLDGLLVPPTRDRLPEWAEVEAGVFTAAVIWLAAGAWTLRRGPAGQTQPARQY